jgi:benzoyl-CoA reductase/2-hydroxyglutaryl-CoA dehydratase subunit BcrC/BadD/HgdB
MMELKDYFDSIRLPSTYIEYEYYQGGLAPVRTRIEAFLETLG